MKMPLEFVCAACEGNGGLPCSECHAERRCHACAQTGLTEDGQALNATRLQRAEAALATFDEAHGYARTPKDFAAHYVQMFGQSCPAEFVDHWSLDRGVLVAACASEWDDGHYDWAALIDEVLAS